MYSSTSLPFQCSLNLPSLMLLVAHEKNSSTSWIAEFYPLPTAPIPRSTTASRRPSILNFLLRSANNSLLMMLSSYFLASGLGAKTRGSRIDILVILSEVFLTYVAIILLVPYSDLRLVGKSMDTVSRLLWLLSKQSDGPGRRGNCSMSCD
jgi:hypothetical protein